MGLWDLKLICAFNLCSFFSFPFFFSLPPFQLWSAQKIKQVSPFWIPFLCSLLLTSETLPCSHPTPLLSTRFLLPLHPGLNLWTRAQVSLPFPGPLSSFPVGSLHESLCFLCAWHGGQRACKADRVWCACIRFAHLSGGEAPPVAHVGFLLAPNGRQDWPATRQGGI